MSTTIMDDIVKVTEGQVTDLALHNLSTALELYVKSRKIRNTCDQVNLLLLMGAIMEIEEPDFIDMISRLNVVIGISSLQKVVRSGWLGKEKGI